MSVRKQDFLYVWGQTCFVCCIWWWSVTCPETGTKEVSKQSLCRHLLLRGFLRQLTCSSHLLHLFVVPNQVGFGICHNVWQHVFFSVQHVKNNFLFAFFNLPLTNCIGCILDHVPQSQYPLFSPCNFLFSGTVPTFPPASLCLPHVSVTPGTLYWFLMLYLVCDVIVLISS